MVFQAEFFRLQEFRELFWGTPAEKGVGRWPYKSPHCIHFCTYQMSFILIVITLKGRCIWRGRGALTKFADIYQRVVKRSIHDYGLPRWLRGNESACQCRRCWVWSLDQEDTLEKEMATQSSILAWKIIWTEEPGGLQSMGVTKSLNNNNNNTYLYLHLRKSTLKCFKLTSGGRGRGSGRKESERTIRKWLIHGRRKLRVLRMSRETWTSWICGCEWKRKW